MTHRALPDKAALPISKFHGQETAVSTKSLFASYYRPQSVIRLSCATTLSVMRHDIMMTYWGIKKMTTAHTAPPECRFCLPKAALCHKQKALFCRKVPPCDKIVPFVFSAHALSCHPHHAATVLQAPCRPHLQDIPHILSVLIHAAIILLIVSRGDIVHPFLIVKIPSDGLLYTLLKL